MLVDEFIEISNTISGGEQLVKVFEEAIIKLGFSKFVYSFITEQANINEQAKHGIIRSYPDDWMKHYTENDYIHFDPTYRLALNASGVFNWDKLNSYMRVSKKEKQVMDEAKEASLMSGVSISIHGANKEIVGLGFASDYDKLDLSTTNLQKLYALSNQFHLVYCDLHAKDPNKGKLNEIHLTEKEREVLLWCSRGKSNGTIAEIMKTSEHAVDFHLRNIYKKLKVNNKTVAVLKAFQERLICL